jgi:SAM-dependent methyltransferase
VTSGEEKDLSAPRGSADYFEQFWSHATGREYAYPRAVPRTQFDLFEREKARLVQRFLSDAAPSVVLEYGCGSAGMSAYLANQGLRVIASDVSLSALMVARANLQQNATEPARALFTAVAADAFHLPFADSSLGCAMSYGLLEHFDEEALAESLAETRRVLRPGGMLVGDVVHGRLSARRVATWLNLSASWVYHALRGRFRELASLHHAYFHSFYENDLDLPGWQRCLERAGFAQVEVLSIRPFPPLAISGRAETLYVRLMEGMLPFYRWFDESQSWLSKRWGWTYLFRAIKPGE